MVLFTRYVAALLILSESAHRILQVKVRTVHVNAPPYIPAFAPCRLTVAPCRLAVEPYKLAPAPCMAAAALCIPATCAYKLTVPPCRTPVRGAQVAARVVQVRGRSVQAGMCAQQVRGRAVPDRTYYLQDEKKSRGEGKSPRRFVLRYLVREPSLTVGLMH